MFLPVVSPSVLKLFYLLFYIGGSFRFSARQWKYATNSTGKVSKETILSATVITDFHFQFIWIQKLNWILLLTIGISFRPSVMATCAE